MAIFRNGVKMGKFESNWKTGLSKQRAQGLLRQAKILPKREAVGGRDLMGEMQTIRTIVGKGEGFQSPADYIVSFKMPKGIDQQKWGSARGPGGQSVGGYEGENKGKVRSGGLDWKTHIMNNSTTDILKARYDAAKMAARTLYKPDGKSHQRAESKLDIYCSKVSIPERQIQTGLYRQAGAAPFPFPQTTVYGAITTSFYCDGAMHIKNYFDTWQKLIHNDLTGNFNFWDEYTAEFDVLTRNTRASGASLKAETPEPSLADEISSDLKDATARFNDATGVENPRSGEQWVTKPPKIITQFNYGVKIFSCFPQIVGELALAHDATDSILTFDVTWSYVKWNPFKMGNIGNRSTINLSVGEFRNEKDGFPFLEDLPNELAGPMTAGLNQNILTSPLSKGSILVG